MSASTWGSEYGNLPQFKRGGDDEKRPRRKWTLWARNKNEIAKLLQDPYRVAKLRRFVGRINLVQKGANLGAYTCMKERKAV